MINKHMVGAQGDGSHICFGKPPVRITKEDALELAAWIVAIADPAMEEFPRKLALLIGEGPTG